MSKQLEGLTFGQALVEMKIGAKVARQDWPEGETLHIKAGVKKVWKTYKDGAVSGHILNSIDLLAEDWKIVGGQDE